MLSNTWVKRVGWFLIGAVGFIMVLYFFELDEMDAILRADLRFVALAFAMGVSVTLASALRLGSIIDFMLRRKVLTFQQYYASLVTSRVLGLFLPRSASEVGVPFATLTMVGKTTPEAAAAGITLDRVFDLTLLLAWLIPALLILFGIVPSSAGLLLFITAVVITMIVALRMHLLVNLTAQVLSQVAGIIGGPAALRRFCQARSRNFTELAQINHLSPKEATYIAGLTVLRYLLNTALLFFVARSIGLEISFHIILLTGAIMQLSQLLAITPGGLGVVEAGSASGLALAGVDGGEIAAFLVGQRIFQYAFFPILGAIIGLTILWRPNRKHGTKVETAP